MLIYNTLSRKKEEFVPANPGKVNIYACGPTVYNLIHIGNARQLCVFDVIRRYLKYKGYDVLYVQNFTDVDDRIIKTAGEKGITSLEYSEDMIKEYFTDAHGLNVKDADIHPKVTDNIPIIIDIVKALIEKGYAYESGGDVYFAAEKFDGYGTLSRNSLDELKENAGDRLDADREKKRSPLDFALWKAAKAGEPYWESPFGDGRPGWHIECSAMSGHFIGDTVDIHGGGADLIFPHHENEIAQSEAATGKPLAKYWVHNGMLNVDSRKMSKSLNNFFLVREASEKFGYEPLRFMLLNAHYKSQMNYTGEVLESASKSVHRLRKCRQALSDREKELNGAGSVKSGGEPSNKAKEIIKKRREQFICAMDDDFNTADGLAALFELVRDINLNIADSGVTAFDIVEYSKLFDEINGVMGLLYEEKEPPTEEEPVPREILELAQKRAAARAEKDFALADKLRADINEKGYVIEETRQGFTVYRADKKS